VDAVFVATPNALHLPAVLAAAAAGKHVLCEKPLALSEAEATRMLDACAKAGVMLRLGLHLRFEQFLDRVGEVLRSGEIGTVRALSIERAAPPAERVPWREDPAQGGSVLYDVGVHLLDLAPRLLGAPLVAVQGMAFPPPRSGRGADTLTLLAESADGVQVTLRVTREAPRAAADVMALGTAGFLRTGPLRWVPEYVLTVSTPDRVREERAPPCDLYRDELDGFARDLADGGTRLGTGADGLRLVRVASAVEEALRTGTRVALSG
jgi:1,5-anhydro-D-fructose reductase (1,5-anhydro-D-mannitol-forming)